MAELGALVVSRSPRSVWWTALPGIGTGFLVTAVLYVAGAGGVTNWVPPTSAFDLRRVILASTAPTTGLALIMLMVVALGGLAGVQRWARAIEPIDRFRAAGPLFWGLTPLSGLILLSLKTPLLVPRYLVCAVPGIALLLAAGAAHAGALVEGERRVKATACALVLILLSLVTAQAAAREQPVHRWDQVAQILTTKSRHGDGLALPERRNRVPLEAALSRTKTQGLMLLDFPRPLGKVRYVEPERSAAATLDRLNGVDRLWLVYQRVFEPSSVALDTFERSRQLQRQFRLTRTWDVTPSIEVRLYERR